MMYLTVGDSGESMLVLPFQINLFQQHSDTEILTFIKQRPETGALFVLLKLGADGMAPFMH